MADVPSVPAVPSNPDFTPNMDTLSSAITVPLVPPSLVFTTYDTFPVDVGFSAVVLIVNVAVVEFCCDEPSFKNS